VTSGSGVRLGVCDICAATFFPARLLCASCGGRTFGESIVTSGLVEEVTTVRRRVGLTADPVVLATVRLPGDVRIIVALAEAVPPGSRVALGQREGAVYGQTLQP
jgi:uncharacterized OB-fold protein